MLAAPPRLRSCVSQNDLLRVSHATRAPSRPPDVQTTMRRRALQRSVLEAIFGSTSRSLAVLQTGRRGEQIRGQVAQVQEVDARQGRGNRSSQSRCRDVLEEHANKGEFAVEIVFN